ncbi:MAG: hypothetical protein NVSMB64_32820 [Candidatus Velthaea sp.]
MRRSILTGIFAVALCAGGFGIAAADEATVSAAETGTAVTATSLTHAAELAAPTDGADLAMWNAAPAPAVAAPPASRSEKNLSPVRRFASGIIARSSAIASNLTRSAMRFMGTPYSFGGTTASGFDCSGYVQHVFAMMGVHLPRTADAQYDAAHGVAKSGMATGDLVFFHTYAPGVSHVGIYLGNDKFIHSSSSHGVTVSSLHDSYWAARYLGAKRVVN